MELFVKHSIKTVSGQYVDLVDPTPEMIHIEDIAHALSHMPRFAGHLKHPYSVAQHSLWCYRNAGITNELEALLHDASEAYLMDVPSPLKDALPKYREIECNLMRVIFQRFGIPYPISDAVKIIDQAALRWEWETLAVNELNCSERPGVVKKEFLTAFNELYYE